MQITNTHLGPEKIGKIMEKMDSVFFIGIGGVNMSSLARLTRAAGYRVSGSDKNAGAETRKMESEGIKIFYVHKADNIEGNGLVVYTVAISDDNPEYRAAVNAGVPCVSRADYMGYLMCRYSNGIGVSGMHGKSTTTAMLAQIYMTSELDPTVLCGADYAPMGGSYRIGDNRNMIFEACEYKDSFLDFYPTTAVVLNIELDHLDYFLGIEHIKSSFTEYISLPSCENAVYNADDDNVRDVVSCSEKKMYSFGLSPFATNYRGINLTTKEGNYSFDVMKNGEFFLNISLSVPGRHNVMNALAALAAADINGVPAEKIAEGLKAFPGADRRQQFKGMLNGAYVYDDYAHHPTEVKATLDSIVKITEDREGGEVICVFQSHTFSRTAAFLNELADALNKADRVIIANIFAARQEDDHSVGSAELVKAIGGKAEYIDNNDGIVARVKELACPGDSVVIMGAGDIYKITQRLI